MPPLNQSLWALLVASLSAGAGWAVVALTSRIERSRQKRYSRQFDSAAALVFGCPFMAALAAQ